MLDIRVEALTKDFADVRAIDGLSFALEPGRVVGVLGPNGSGKTTTLRVLLGLVSPTSGTALIGGRRFTELDDPPRQVGAVLETRAFHPWRTARDHLRIAALEAGVAAARVDEVLDLVGLAHAAHRKAGKFSHGMRQRLSLATALLGDPSVLILDEPTNGLDPGGTRWLRDFLRSLADDGRTVVVASHALAELANTVDEVLILDRGRLAAHRQMADIESLEDVYLDATTDRSS